MTSELEVEQLIQEKQKTAPRVTPADLDAAIKRVHYFTAGDGIAGALSSEESFQDLPEEARIIEVPLPLDLLTFCVIELHNGFTVTGESACASPENFDAEIGRKIAYTNAREKLWPLLGYALKDKLYKESLND